MAKFEHLVLNVKDNEFQNFEELRQIQKNILSNANVIYIYRSSKSKKFISNKPNTLSLVIDSITLGKKKSLMMLSLIKLLFLSLLILTVRL